MKNILREDYERQLERANKLERQVEYLLKENELLRIQLVNLRNARLTGLDIEIKKKVKVKGNYGRNL